jgi:TatD DNase family protein
MLHIRSGLTPEENAYPDAIELLKKHAKVPGNVHFFAGTWEEGKQFIELGFRLSFTGVITFTKDYDEVIKKAPLNMILSETDAPFVAPVPHRGERNEPAYVTEVAQAIARIRGESIEKVAPHLIDNAQKLFLNSRF